MPLYAYLNLQAKPNTGIHQYLASRGNKFKGFSVFKYQKECTLNNRNNILYNKNSN